MDQSEPAKKHHFIVYVLAAGYYIFLIGVCLPFFRMTLDDYLRPPAKGDWRFSLLLSIVMSILIFGIGWCIRYAIEACFRRFPSSEGYSSALASRAIACLLFLVIALSIWYILATA